MRILIAGLLAVGALCTSSLAQEKTQEGNNRKVWVVVNWGGYYVMVQDPSANQMCRELQAKAGLVGKKDVFVFEPSLEAGKWTLFMGMGQQFLVNESDLSPVLGKLGPLSTKVKQGLCHPGNDSDPVHVEMTTDTKEESELLAKALQ